MNFYKEFSKRFIIFSRGSKYKFRNYTKETNSEKEIFKQTLTGGFQKTNRFLEQANKKIPNILALFGVISAGIGAYFYYLSIQELKNKKKESHIREDARKTLLEPVKFVEELDYVERKELEERLNHLVGNLNQRKYVIIVGSKGSGKTTLWKHVLNGKKGVVFVKFDGETKLDNFKQKLLKAIKVPIEPWNEGNF
jgi:ABC-type multidrug transport system fused ATPase/permease subunit